MLLEELKNIFIIANKNFIDQNQMLFRSKVSERTLCGALMIHLHDTIKKTKYSNYYVDIEYNRNMGSPKEIITKSNSTRRINCDLIVHSRGENIVQDNLIAIEMKKSPTTVKSRNSDKERLMCLTRNSFDNEWTYDGTSLPKYVCRYPLGIYYEINLKRRRIILEYYTNGEKSDEEIINF